MTKNSLTNFLPFILRRYPTVDEELFYVKRGRELSLCLYQHAKTWGNFDNILLKDLFKNLISKVLTKLLHLVDDAAMLVLTHTIHGYIHTCCCFLAILAFLVPPCARTVPSRFSLEFLKPCN